jgi:hypothetical protein
VQTWLVRAKIFIFVSLVLNVGLAAALWRYYDLAGRPAHQPAPEAAGLTITNLRVAKTNLVLRPRAFAWPDLESTNYERYVMNLRGIGCPETTVRDIILADVNQIYARKRHELNVTTNDLKWWQSDPDPGELQEQLARAQSLENDRRKLLTRLLGPNWDQNADNAAEPLQLAGPVLGALSPEAKQKVQDIVDQSQAAARSYLQQRQEAGETPDPLELAQLREQTRKNLEAVLNPEELQEFLLRFSYNATALRQELRGFSATPDEFRTLFQAVDPIDRELQLLRDDNDPMTEEQRQILQEQRLAAIQGALAPGRYDTYRILTDSDYRAALVDAEQAGASPQAGRTLYEVNQAAAAERERINGDSSLTPQQRQQELSYLDQQQKAVRATVLGLTPPPDTTGGEQPDNVFSHRAGPHDTLAALSLYYRVPLDQLLRANPGLDAGAAVPPNQTIRIPEPAPLPWMQGIVPAK